MSSQATNTGLVVGLVFGMAAIIGILLFLIFRMRSVRARRLRGTQLFSPTTNDDSFVKESPPDWIEEKPVSRTRSIIGAFPLPPASSCGASQYSHPSTAAGDVDLAAFSSIALEPPLQRPKLTKTTRAELDRRMSVVSWFSLKSKRKSHGGGTKKGIANQFEWYRSGANQSDEVVVDPETGRRSVMSVLPPVEIFERFTSFFFGPKNFA